MGFFSWQTTDTNKSIANHYSRRPTFKVHMHDDKGNIWTEINYEGYGEFGGKDFHELLAEMHGKKGRDEGLDLAFAGIPMPRLWPQFTESGDPPTDFTREPERCRFQGYFYDDIDEIIEALSA